MRGGFVKTLEVLTRGFPYNRLFPSPCHRLTMPLFHSGSLQNRGLSSIQLYGYF